MSKSAEDFLHEAKTFYFDLAFAGYDGSLQLPLDFAKPGHVLYGSDCPFGRDSIVYTRLYNIDKVLKLREDRAMIQRDAVLSIFPWSRTAFETLWILATCTSMT